MEKRKVDVHAFRIWGSFLSCALTLGRNSKFGERAEDLASSKKIFHLLEKELETALVERDGYRNRVRDLELELAESFMACERATWQMQGLLLADRNLNLDLTDSDGSGDASEGFGSLSKRRDRFKLSLPVASTTVKSQSHPTRTTTSRDKSGSISDDGDCDNSATATMTMKRHANVSKPSSWGK